MLKLETEIDLVQLHAGNVKESLHLEYKASDAADRRDDKKKIEMARDVSAFANADGGQIVYGMTEKDHNPNGLDAGYDPKEYPEIWFEQILQQHASPKIEGVRPHHVPLSTGRVAVVIDIPASKGDPHQVDGRYYKRHNFNRLVMEHYEVRDMFRRSNQPDLYVSFHFDRMQNEHTLRYAASEENHQPVGLSPLATNRSNEPALFVVATIAIDADLLVNFDNYERVGVNNIFGRPMQMFRLRFTPSSTMPIFKEKPTLLPNLGIVVPDKNLFRREPYGLGYEISTPGCHREASGLLFCEDGKLLRLQFSALSQ